MDLKDFLLKQEFDMAKLKGTPEELKGDFQTPPEVARYMASLIPQHLEWMSFLEPTPGNGNLVNAINLEMKKRNLKEPHYINAPLDYFLMRNLLFEKYYDAVILNPPFSDGTCILDNAPEEWKKLKGLKLGYEFLKDAMQLSNNVICLLPWFVFADSDVRLRQIMSFGLKSITALPRKTFEYARIQTVVLELEKGYKGEPIFKSLDMIQGTKHNHPKLEL